MREAVWREGVGLSSRDDEGAGIGMRFQVDGYEERYYKMN